MTNTLFASQDQTSTLSSLRADLLTSEYTGWDDFLRNIFWLAVICGSLILLHILLLLFLRWRTKTPLHGALSFPRFELFLLVLALPAIAQACAFIISGTYANVTFAPTDTSLHTACKPRLSLCLRGLVITCAYQQCQSNPCLTNVFYFEKIKVQ